MEALRIFMLLLTVERCVAYSLWCYSCSIKDQCFILDKSDASTWTECDPGTTHCVMERTVSAVTGAVVENRMCGGQVYVDKNLPLADGCYVIARQEDSRINTTRCYCSTDYCNLSNSLHVSHGVVLLSLIFLATVMHFFVT